MRTGERKTFSPPHPLRDDDDILTINIFLREIDRRRTRIYASREKLIVKDAYGALVAAALDEYEVRIGQKLIPSGLP